MMDEGIYEKYLLAGRSAGEARDHAASLIKPGARLLDVARAAEARITESGARVAFPINLSINNVAAHYTPKIGDETVFREGDLVKIDVGAHVDGYIGDTARTVEVGCGGRWDSIVTAAERALALAIELIQPGVDLSIVGEAIEDEIRSRGFVSIKNLTGHSLQQYNLHAGLTVPNTSGYKGGRRLKSGDVIAIEPFATNGMGHVDNGPISNIYHFVRMRPLRHQSSRTLLQSIQKEFSNLPFAERWCEPMLGDPIKLGFALKLLTKEVLIRPYAQLVEAGGGQVAQAEHTVLVKKDGCEILTVPNWL
ncbi:MAG: type II methionyl aminopeptidase [Thermoplasmata archaeon HGW-Thermoplasmata-1]|nr:MAG: type II methionyl aminopeptidase [Thermoplasmata archaeon HGW-Thermoplasmata-1]